MVDILTHEFTSRGDMNIDINNETTTTATMRSLTPIQEQTSTTDLPLRTVPPSVSAAPQKVPLSAKRKSSSDVRISPRHHRSDQSTPPPSDTEAVDAGSPQTLPSPITPVQGATPDSRMTSLSPTSMERMTTRCTLPSKEINQGRTDDTLMRTLSRNLGGGLYSRRIAARKAQLDATNQGSAHKRVKLEIGFATPQSQEMVKQDHLLQIIDTGITSLSLTPSDTDYTQQTARLAATSLQLINHATGYSSNYRNRSRTPGLLQELRQRNVPRVRESPDLIDRFAQDRSLLFALISVLPIPSLIDLYAIHKPFHKAFNEYATASILASADTWSPDAKRIFPWRCYLKLCIKDPIQRQQSRPKADGTPSESANGASLHNNTIEELIPDEEDLFINSRDVPSLRWLQMVAWRHGVAQDIVDVLHTKGAHISNQGVDVIKRLWLAMDLPLNAYRRALFRSKTYFPDETLMQAMNLMMKVDMALTDPGLALFPPMLPPDEVNDAASTAEDPTEADQAATTTSPPGSAASDDSEGEDGEFFFPGLPPPHGAAETGVFRQALLGENSFSPLWRVLHGWSPWEGLIRGRGWDAERYEDPPAIDRIDVLKLYARHKLRNETFAGYLQADRIGQTCRWAGIPTEAIQETRFERVGLLPASSAARETSQGFSRGPIVNGIELVPLMTPDQILLGEMLRRGIRFGFWPWKFLCEGHLPEFAERTISVGRS